MLGKTAIDVRVGTAGWSLPRDLRDAFAGEGSHLERYARRFPCVEINSTFYRPHRRQTYERWSRSVPDAFRFALKLPKEITHTRRLAGTEEALTQFLADTSSLGDKRDVLLVQLPPSFAYDPALARAFFTVFRSHYAGRIACEPRHATWFETQADAGLAEFGVARVAADPAPVEVAGVPGGCVDFRYFRLHGSPRMYYSSYDDVRLDALAQTLRTADQPAWCIFDNTTLGAATANALTIADRFAGLSL